MLQGDFQSSLNLLKSELIQAGDALTSWSKIAVEISTHKLVFKTDRYRDGDLAYTQEKFPIVMILEQKFFPENPEILLQNTDWIHTCTTIWNSSSSTSNLHKGDSLSNN